MSSIDLLSGVAGLPRIPEVPPERMPFDADLEALPRTFAALADVIGRLCWGSLAVVVLRGTDGDEWGSLGLEETTAGCNLGDAHPFAADDWMRYEIAELGLTEAFGCHEGDDVESLLMGFGVAPGQRFAVLAEYDVPVRDSYTGEWDGGGVKDFHLVAVESWSLERVVDAWEAHWLRKGNRLVFGLGGALGVEYVGECVTASEPGAEVPRIRSHFDDWLLTAAQALDSTVPVLRNVTRRSEFADRIAAEAEKVRFAALGKWR